MIMNIIFFATMYPIVFIMLFLFSTQNKYENGRLFAVNMKKEWIKDATVADIRQKFKKEMRYYAILLAIVPFISLLTCGPSPIALIPFSNNSSILAAFALSL